MAEMLSSRFEVKSKLDPSGAVMEVRITLWSSSGASSVFMVFPEKDNGHYTSNQDQE